LYKETWKDPPLKSSITIETQPSGVFQNIPYIFTKPLDFYIELFHSPSQSLRDFLIVLFVIGCSFTAYSFKVGTCSIFFITPDMPDPLINPIVIISYNYIMGCFGSLNFIFLFLLGSYYYFECFECFECF